MKRIVFFCPKCDTEEYVSIPNEITLTFSIRCEACNAIFIYTAQPAQQKDALDLSCTCAKFENGTKVFPMRECDGCRKTANQ